jgi:hypothetical protein
MEPHQAQEGRSSMCTLRERCLPHLLKVGWPDCMGTASNIQLSSPFLKGRNAAGAAVCWSPWREPSDSSRSSQDWSPWSTWNLQCKDNSPGVINGTMVWIQAARQQSTKMLGNRIHKRWHAPHAWSSCRPLLPQGKGAMRTITCPRWASRPQIWFSHICPFSIPPGILAITSCLLYNAWPWHPSHTALQVVPRAVLPCVSYLRLHRHRLAWGRKRRLGALGTVQGVESSSVGFSEQTPVLPAYSGSCPDHFWHMWLPTVSSKKWNSRIPDVGRIIQIVFQPGHFWE